MTLKIAGRRTCDKFKEPPRMSWTQDWEVGTFAPASLALAGAVLKHEDHEGSQLVTSLFLLQKRTDETAFQKLMSNLDCNKDNEVDFQEYCVFLSCIAMMCNEFFEGFPDKQPRKK
ncbi:hypothetical protein M91_01302 [Bos mutus]|uniref:Protein S100-A4 n=1 Tax=Bos mutus TaxID=72004 RepID=L8IBR4_9CETA|nr:hypothetical protein M91_01302 [Bos mutus]